MAPTGGCHKFVILAMQGFAPLPWLGVEVVTNSFLGVVRLLFLAHLGELPPPHHHLEGVE
jgi:hypothetical protein